MSEPCWISIISMVDNPCATAARKNAVSATPGMRDRVTLDIRLKMNAEKWEQGGQRENCPRNKDDGEPSERGREREARGRREVE